jgi:uncharacterized protein YbbC (DUF1343 family)
MVVKLKILVALICLIPALNFRCAEQIGEAKNPNVEGLHGEAAAEPIRPGAYRMERYLPLLEGKKVGLLVNQTSMVGTRHLIDTLLKSGVEVVKIFAPEHGYRGTASDGEEVAGGRDAATGIPVFSLYGKKRKPDAAAMEGLDIVVFDIQDVGVRFYTYTATLGLMMEACAENERPLLLLDRPNPNGHYVDGPMLRESHKSFVGPHPVPAVYGMTTGEWASLVNGEGWLANGMHCDLTVIPCVHYDHRSFYQLPVKPSPNLPNMRSVYLYPSLCFFEGTVVSVGRGTDKQFQVYGAPGLEAGDYFFTPQPNAGSKYPPQQGQRCRGFDLSGLPEDKLQAAGLSINYLLEAYRAYPDKEHFFLPTLYFDKLAGSAGLRQQIQEGLGEQEIRASWQPGLDSFKIIRRKYLLYEDFE